MSADRASEPIPGPSPVGPEYTFAPDLDIPQSPALVIGRKLLNIIRTPAHWIRENVIEANRGPKYYWYHRKFERAVPIDECYMDDLACIYEANVEYRRNFMVDRSTLDLLRYRRDSCYFWNLTTHDAKLPSENCKEIEETYDKEEINFFIKYGDLHYNASVMHAYNKQKHRMIVERRRAIKAEKEALKFAKEEEGQ